jgi:hypothetical protein
MTRGWFGQGDCKGIEVCYEAGDWRRVYGVVQVGTLFRRAHHDYEPIPPRYLRCRFCGDVLDTEGPVGEASA